MVLVSFKSKNMLFCLRFEYFFIVVSNIVNCFHGVNAAVHNNNLRYLQNDDGGYDDVSYDDGGYQDDEHHEYQNGESSSYSDGGNGRILYSGYSITISPLFLCLLITNLFMYIILLCVSWTKRYKYYLRLEEHGIETRSSSSS